MLDRVLDGGVGLIVTDWRWCFFVVEWAVVLWCLVMSC